MVGSITDLAAQSDDSADAIWSSHSLEHLSSDKLPRALAEFRRVIWPGAVANLAVPDIQSTAGQIATGEHESGAFRSPAGAIAVADVLGGTVRRLLPVGSISVSVPTAGSVAWRWPASIM